MANLKNYFNPILNDGKIFTREEIKDMSTSEFSKYESAIDYQMTNLGVPSNSHLINNEDVVFVHSYTKSDGTKVKTHYRTKPDNSITNNFSYNADINNLSADFSDWESNNYWAQQNADKNRNRPISREFMNIALSKVNFPESKYLSVLPDSTSKIINKHFNLNGTVLNPKVENGYFSGILFDKYDFDKWKLDFNNINLVGTNNAAYYLQNFGYLKNYYTLIPVKFKVK